MQNSKQRTPIREWFEYPLLDELEHCEPMRNPNYMLIPVTRWTFIEDQIDKFNEIYRWCLQERHLVKLKRTNSGGIMAAKPSEAYHRWDIRQMKNMEIEITLCLPQGAYRIRLSPHPAKKNGEEHIYSGAQAFRKFKQLCEKRGIDLDAMAIENGKEVNAEIESPIIRLLNKDKNRDKIFTSAHHLDFRSSYASGLMRTHPEFKDLLEWLYDQRKTHPEYKDLLNLSIGYMHSPLCKHKWAHLAKDAIGDNNKRILTMLWCLETMPNIEPILINTDGIWYNGLVYHDSDEGVRLGQWHNDYMYCTLRVKSDGAYEFIDSDGVYHPVIRGRTRLDKIKDRSQWQWGDIYTDEAKEIRYIFIEGKGVVENNG